MLDGLTVVYRSNVDLYFYIMGSSHENEVSINFVAHAHFISDLSTNSKSMSLHQNVIVPKQLISNKNYSNSVS